MFGFCYIKQALEFGCLNNYGFGKGGYFLYGHNTGYIHSHVQQNYIAQQITQFENNDVIHVLYIPEENKVEIKNVTKNQTVTVSMNKIEGN